MDEKTVNINNSDISIVGDYGTVIFQPKSGQPAPYILPQDIGDFTGRVDYIAQIEDILNRGKFKIVAVSGMGGVGKSALAIRVAYRLKDRYPDAQLYINLYGQTPELALEPKTVLIRFLTALMGDESQLPTDLDELRDKYRSILADKRALIILDNARDEAQIRDLVFSSPNCAVVVTSRSPLTGLAGTGSINLEPMMVGIDQVLGEAELLFQAILQDDRRAEAELTAARKIVNLCGGLPIAIRITAATLKQQIWSRKPLQAYAQELATESTRLNKLESDRVENAIPGQGSVRASFNLSYRMLNKEDQQLFCWAGGLPCVNFGVKILAAVMKWEDSSIEERLGRLLEAQVLELRGENRYGWHDLMRLFAKENLTKPERETVLDRGLTWYCEQTNLWGNRLNSLLCRQIATKTESTAQEEEILLIMSLEWFAEEQDNWIDVIKNLTQVPRPDDAVNLVANLVPFFSLRGIWGDWIATHEMVKVCAERSGASLALGLARTLHNLGKAYQFQYKWAESINCYRKSLVIFRRLKKENEIAQTSNNLGNVYQTQGKLDWAIKCYEKSLEIFEQLKDKDGIAQTNNNLGSVYQTQGKLDWAIKCYEKSLEIFEQLKDEDGIVQTRNNLGSVYQIQGDRCQIQGALDVAIKCYEKSLEIFEQLEDKEGIAQTFNNLGNVYQTQGNFDGALDNYKKSLEIFHRLGDENGVIQTLNTLGHVYRSQGDMYRSQGNLAEAITGYEKYLEIFRRLGDDHWVAKTLNNLGNIYQNQGKWDEAISCYKEFLETKRQLGNDNGMAQTLNNLGNMYASKSQWDGAIACYEQSLKTKLQVGDEHLLYPSSPEFKTVEHSIETPTRPLQVNYLLPLAVSGSILFCIAKGYWLLAIFGVATILFCFRRSIFRQRGI